MVEQASTLLGSIKILVGITDDKQDELINELISNAQEQILAYVNQDNNKPVGMPDDIDFIIKDVVVQMYNRLGDEGKASSSEGSVSSTWSDIDLAKYASFLDKYRNQSYGQVRMRFL
ncbi:DNA packaging protein [Ligilactobacillus pobuzihii]|uniref:head-tail connector protein n=1 Tax=Ligilactobacillus pobuzihii TaxID=449659 RepID=UPI0019D2D42C|nr:head-tail connector protein [Ligilactobacillus pobuzihii]MBN7275098.1 DNA packaging protein [Ligilactobacillus pobuzihii]